MSHGNDLANNILYRTFYFLATNAEALITGRDPVEYHGVHDLPGNGPMGGPPETRNTPVVQTFCGHLPDGQSPWCDYIYPLAELDIGTTIIVLIGFVLWSAATVWSLSGFLISKKNAFIEASGTGDSIWPCGPGDWGRTFNQRGDPSDC